jgi:hypothetical protein
MCPQVYLDVLLKINISWSWWDWKPFGPVPSLVLRQRSIACGKVLVAIAVLMCSQALVYVSTTY